ncbi:MAG: hypothetical protein U0457_02900 [Candidatus Sericytochromatia bacterium]
MKKNNFLTILSFIATFLLVINACSFKNNENNTTINTKISNKNIKNDNFSIKNILPTKTDPNDELKFLFKSKDVEMNMSLERKFPKNKSLDFKEFSVTPSNLNIIKTTLPTKKEVIIDYKKTEEEFEDWMKKLYKTSRTYVITEHNKNNKILKQKFEENLKNFPKHSKERSDFIKDYETKKELRNKAFRVSLKKMKDAYKTDLKNLHINLKKFYGIEDKKFKVKDFNLWNALAFASPVVGFIKATIDTLQTISSYIFSDVLGEPEPIETTISKFSNGLSDLIKIPTPTVTNTTTDSAQTLVSNTYTSNAQADYLSAKVGDSTSLDNVYGTVSAERNIIRIGTTIGDRAVETLAKNTDQILNEEIFKKILSILDKDKNNTFVIPITPKKILNLVGVILNNNSEECAKNIIYNYDEIQNYLYEYLKAPTLDPKVINSNCTLGMIIVQTAKNNTRNINISSSVTQKITLSLVFRSDLPQLNVLVQNALVSYEKGKYNTTENMEKVLKIVRGKELSLQIETPNLCSQAINYQYNSGSQLATAIAEIPAKSLLFDGNYKIKYLLKDLYTNEEISSTGNQPIEVNLAKLLGGDIGNINLGKSNFFENHPITPLRMYDLERIGYTGGLTNPANTSVPNLQASPFNFSVYIENDSGNLFDIDVNRVFSGSVSTEDKICLSKKVYGVECADMTKTQFAVNPARFESGIYEVKTKYSNISPEKTDKSILDCNSYYSDVMDSQYIQKREKCRQNLEGYSERSKKNYHPFVVLHTNYSTFARIMKRPEEQYIDTDYSKLLTGNMSQPSNYSSVASIPAMNDSIDPDRFSDEVINDYQATNYFPTPPVDIISTKVVNKIIKNTPNFNSKGKTSRALFGDLIEKHETYGYNSGYYDAFNGLSIKECISDKYINVGAVVNLTNDHFYLNEPLLNKNVYIPMKLQVVKRNYTTGEDEIMESWNFKAKVGSSTIVQNYWDGKNHGLTPNSEIESPPDYTYGRYKVVVSIDNANLNLSNLSVNFDNAYVTYPYISKSSTDADIFMENDNSCIDSTTLAQGNEILDELGESFEHLNFNNVDKLAFESQDFYAFSGYTFNTASFNIQGGTGTIESQVVNEIDNMKKERDLVKKIFNSPDAKKPQNTKVIQDSVKRFVTSKNNVQNLVKTNGGNNGRIINYLRGIGAYEEFIFITTVGTASMIAINDIVNPIDAVVNSIDYTKTVKEAVRIRNPLSRLLRKVEDMCKQDVDLIKYNNFKDKARGVISDFDQILYELEKSTYTITNIDGLTFNYDIFKTKLELLRKHIIDNASLEYTTTIKQDCDCPVKNTNLVIDDETIKCRIKSIRDPLKRTEVVKNLNILDSVRYSNEISPTNCFLCSNTFAIAKVQYLSDNLANTYNFKIFYSVNGGIKETKSFKRVVSVTEWENMKYQEAVKFTQDAYHAEIKLIEYIYKQFLGNTDVRANIYPDREMCSNCELALFGGIDIGDGKRRKSVKDITPNITVENNLPSIYKSGEKIPTLAGRIKGLKNYDGALN